MIKGQRNVHRSRKEEGYRRMGVGGLLPFFDAVPFFACGITSEGVKVLRNFRKLKKVLNFGVENRQRKRKELDNQYQALNFESG